MEMIINFTEKFEKKSYEIINVDEIENYKKITVFLKTLSENLFCNSNFKFDSFKKSDYKRKIWSIEDRDSKYFSNTLLDLKLALESKKREITEQNEEIINKYFIYIIRNMENHHNKSFIKLLLNVLTNYLNENNVDKVFQYFCNYLYDFNDSNFLLEVKIF